MHVDDAASIASTQIASTGDTAESAHSVSLPPSDAWSRTASDAPSPPCNNSGSRYSNPIQPSDGSLGGMHSARSASSLQCSSSRRSPTPVRRTAQKLPTTSGPERKHKRELREREIIQDDDELSESTDDEVPILRGELDELLTNLKHDLVEEATAKFSEVFGGRIDTTIRAV